MTMAFNPFTPGIGTAALSGSNLTMTQTVGGTWTCARTTHFRNAGKMVFEVLVSNAPTTNKPMIGIARVSHTAGTPWTSTASLSYSYYGNNGNKYSNNTNAAYGNTFTTGDRIACAIDFTGLKVWFAKNDAWQASGDPGAGTGEAYTIVAGYYVPFVSLFDVNVVTTIRLTAASIVTPLPSGFSAIGDSLLTDPFPTTGFLVDALVSANALYYGAGYIKGGPETDPDSGVLIGGVGASRRVMLYEMPSRRPVQMKLSGADGSFRFDNLDPNRQFLVMAEDHTGVYLPVVVDRITPVV